MRILTLGNPGTGKTYNLVQEINKLLKEGYDPGDITILSHTRVAASEIASRAESKGINASTIHSLAYRMAEIDKSQVVNRRETKEFSQNIGIPMKGGSGAADESLEIGDEYLAVIDFAKACCMPSVWAYNKRNRPGKASDFKYFEENYDHWKQSYGLIDFSDMLSMAMESDKTEKFPALLVDEAQDLSKMQWKLIEKISVDTKHMMVTGDPDQALFTWGGAWPEGMMEWAKNNNAEIKELSQSYRIPKEPYKLSREIITLVKNRYEKNYKPIKKKGKVKRFTSLSRFDFRELESGLILYRNHALRKAIEEELIACGKAYTTLNGFKGACHSKFGKAIQAWISIRNSEFPDQKDINNVKKVATPTLLKAIAENDLDKIKGMRAEMALVIPYFLLNYYRFVDFSKAKNILLSTIHGAKGMEHENVIVINGMTQRVLDNAMRNPDPEYQVWYVAVTRTMNKLFIIDGEGVHSPI